VDPDDEGKRSRAFLRHKQVEVLRAAVRLGVNEIAFDAKFLGECGRRRRERATGGCFSGGANWSGADA
jgi:hypothetical protein